MKVVAVTDVHEVFWCDAALRLMAAGETPPGAEYMLDAEQTRGGTELYREECAETYTNNTETPF